MVRKYTFFWVLLLALLLVPSRAFAWDFLSDGQMWAGDVGSDHCATVHAGEIYDAATYAVGSDPNKISASVRVKLSDPDYGGRFYEYAQTFHKMESWDDYPEWLPAYVGVAQLISNGLIGDFNIYNSEASSTLYNGAVLDFQRVLDGEDLGGGGGGFEYDGSLPSTFVLNSYIGSDCHNHNSWDANRYFPPTGSVSFSLSSVSTTESYLNRVGARYVYVIYQRIDKRWGNGSSCYDRLYFICSTSEVQFSYNIASGAIKQLNIILSCPDGNIYTTMFENLNIFRMDGWPPSYAGSKTMPVSNGSIRGHSFTISGNVGNSYYVTSSVTNGIGFHSDPSGDWPDPETPVTPTPPEQPTPTAPTVTPDTDPTEPVVTWPTSPTVVLPTQPTPSTTPSGLDYTGLLTLINDNLISIDDYVQAFNSSFNSFRSDFVTAVDSIVDSIRNIYNYLGHLNDILEVHCKHIRDQIEDSVYNLELYLKDLFEWLPQQLNFDAEFNYDDSYVTMLLRRILNKIPGGSSGTPVTYKPNPQSDEPGFFDWLLDLWHRFLIDLVSVLPDSLGGLVDTFSQLTHYFPFSIPWDVFALLSLFSHDPVTPVFDIPWGYGGGDGEVQLIHIDLSVWNDMMATVRPVFLVGFCIRLALVTKEMLSNFDINKGGV